MNRPFRQVYEEHEGKVSDTWSLYLDEWERVFSAYRDQPVQILEIGVQNGGSLEIWGKTFLKAKNIIGCDIDEKCRLLRFEDTRITIIIGDANTDHCENEILQKAPSLDIIIDDGSHRSSEIVRSFARYFPHLNNDGIYIIEDLHASYWKDFEGGLNNPLSAMAFFKRLTDIINYEHWRNNTSRGKLLQKFSEEFGVMLDDMILARIHSIEFLNSLCIIKKLPPDNNVLGKRVVVGKEDIISSGWEKYNGTAINDFPADGSDDSNLDVNELIAQSTSLSKGIMERDQAISDLTQQLSDKGNAIQDLKNQMEEKEKAVQNLTKEISEFANQKIKYESEILQKGQILQTILSRLANKQNEVVSLENKNKEFGEQLDNQTALANAFSSQLWEIKQSRAWNIVQILWKLRLRFFPSGSIQTRMMRSTYRSMRLIRKEGIVSSLKQFGIWLSKLPHRSPRLPSPEIPTNDIQKTSIAPSLVYPDPVYIPNSESEVERIQQKFITIGHHIQPDDPTGLWDKITSCLKHRHFLVSISHDDYLTINFGGIQMFMADEQAQYDKREISYVHLYPMSDADLLMIDAPIVIGLNVDSVHIGDYLIEDLVEVFDRLFTQKYVCVSLIMHHFKGWTLNALKTVISAINPNYFLFYIHDFYSLCSQYTLLRNQREFCNAPPLYSNACTICSFGEKRKMHLPQVSSLFTSFPFIIIAPSRTAQALWQKVFPKLSNEIRVVPHLILKKTTFSLPLKNYEQINIAYAGQGVHQKGWDHWRKVVNQFTSCPDYKFIHLGSWAGEFPELFENIRVTSQNRTAMLDALGKHQIDVLFQWSISPETFSFVLYEAISTGCFILTMYQSGNIADYVNENKNGRVFESFDTLVDYLSSPDNLRDDLLEFRRKYPTTYTLEHNDTLVDMVKTTLRDGGSG